MPLPTRSRRRALAAILAARALAWQPALAQMPAPGRRVALLSSGKAGSGEELLRAFIDALRSHGWVEGKGLTLDIRYAQGDPARLPQLTQELLALGPDVFVATVDLYALAAAQATKTVPIVFMRGFDPVGIGLVQSLARPGGNVTGFSVLNDELNAKRLGLLKEILPGISRVGVLLRDGDARAQSVLESTRRAGQSVGVTFVPLVFRGPDDIVPAIAKASQNGLAALMNVPDPMLFEERRRIADACLRYRVATSFGQAEFADAGMLMSYGSDLAAMYRRSAALVDRILRGATPASIPVEQVSVYELVVNLKTARALGIKVPNTVLLQATRVIE